MIIRTISCLFLCWAMAGLTSLHAQGLDDRDRQSVGDNSPHSGMSFVEHLTGADSAPEVLRCFELYNRKELNQAERFDLCLESAVRLYEFKDLANAKVFLDEAKKLLPGISSDRKKGRYYTYAGWVDADNKKYNEALVCFKTASQYYAGEDCVVEKGNAFNSAGAMYWYLRNYASALSCFNQAYESGKLSGDKELVMKGLTNKGVVLTQLAQFSDALECYEEALGCVVVDDDGSRASVLNNLGNVHYSLKQYNSAIRCFSEALGLYRKLDDEAGMGLCHNNLGEVYLKLGEVGLALQSYRTSLEYIDMNKDSSSIAIAYVNMGKAHQSSKSYLEAVSYFERALKIMVSHEDPSLEAEAYLHLGQVMVASSSFGQAADYLDMAIRLARQLDEKTLLAECYKAKSDLYRLKKDFKQALVFKSLYADIKDSIFDEQALVNSARMEAVYNLLEKEEKISELEKENISKDEDLERVKEIRSLYLVISAALLGFILFMILLYRLRRRTSLQLREKNKELAQLNATKDKFFSIIAHDLKSPFSSLMGFAEMLCLHAESKNTNEIIDYAQIIHNSTKRLLGLVENLLQWSRTQLGTTEYKPTKIDVSIHTNNIVSLLRLNAEEKDIVISSRVDKDLLAWADLNLFSTVLRNLIGNAIKFSRVGSVICVSANRVNGSINVAVSDTGVGMREENLERLFQVDTTFTTRGTFNEKGTGIGLVLCKEFVEINKGDIWAESELEKGSTFTFTLPAFAN